RASGEWPGRRRNIGLARGATPRGIGPCIYGNGWERALQGKTRWLAGVCRLRRWYGRRGREKQWTVHHGGAGGGGAYGRSAGCGLPTAGLGRSTAGAMFSTTLTVSATVETTMPPRLQRKDGPPA